MMYERLIDLFGAAVLNKLQTKTCLVVGLGGVGGSACEALVRSGIGGLIICDFDVVEESNLNRQVVATTHTIGEPKTAVLEKMLRAINPNLQLTVINDKVSEAVFNYHFDFAIDAIDDVPSKIAFIQALLTRNIPFISAMGAAKKTRPELITVMKLHKTTYDPLARIIRKAFPNGTFPVVCSTETPQGEKLGSYYPVTSLFGIYCADYALKYLMEH